MRPLPSLVLVALLLPGALNAPVVHVIDAPRNAAARQPGCFVPNLGQWTHLARFVHRSGAMTVFLEERSFAIELRTAAIRMTFVGDGDPQLVGERPLPGTHNYFLGNSPAQWRTGVPRFASVLYEQLYEAIDLRIREANDAPEYDLILAPGAKLASVVVRVDGATGLAIAADGALEIATAAGVVRQPPPETWETDAAGRRRSVACQYVLLGPHRFGFAAADWAGDAELTIDPKLLWSTYLGGNNYDVPTATEVDEATGVVTVGGFASSANFPTTVGAYKRTNVQYEAFVSRLDPRRSGAAQLLYSTFLGGRHGGNDWLTDLDVDRRGVVTMVGFTSADYFPVTSNVYQSKHKGGGQDAFVAQLDPNRTGTAQLVYSTLLGGNREDAANVVTIDAGGAIVVAGATRSTDFPSTRGTYDATFNGSNRDVFVARLDPTKRGTAQLLESTYLGGNGYDRVAGVAVDASGVVTVAGFTSSTNFPTTTNAYDATYNGGGDVFVSRLDPRRTGAARLVYSTHFGGAGMDEAYRLVEDRGVVTLTGVTTSTNMPTTFGAYDRSYNGPFSGRNQGDAYLAQLDVRRRGSAQLVYSTFLGGSLQDRASELSLREDGSVIVAGSTASWDFPTTRGAYDTTHNGNWDVFVCRLRPLPVGTSGLAHATFFGSSGSDMTGGLAVDGSGVATVAGFTQSTSLPTTSNAFDRTFGGGYNDGFVMRLDLDATLQGDVHALSRSTGGTQRLTVNAGRQHAGRHYWIFGSVSGTRPGVVLPGVHIPLNPDAYTSLAMSAVNSAVFTRFRGTLDANGLASARFNVPAGLPLPAGFTFHHAYLVFDATGKLHMASNAVPLRLR